MVRWGGNAVIPSPKAVCSKPPSFRPCNTQRHEKHSRATFLVPPHRVHDMVEPAAPNAARPLKIQCDEALPALGFRCAVLHDAHTTCVCAFEPPPSATLHARKRARPTAPHRPSPAAGMIGKLGPWETTNSWGVSSFFFLLHPNFDYAEPTQHAACAPRCVEQAASQRARSTAAILFLTVRRCAPSPCATSAPIPDSASSQSSARTCAFPARRIPYYGSD